jgi:hypothetical protein
MTETGYTWESLGRHPLASLSRPKGEMLRKDEFSPISKIEYWEKNRKPGEEIRSCNVSLLDRITGSVFCGCHPKVG